MSSTSVTFNPFTKNFDFVGVSTGGSAITITGDSGGPQTASSFVINGMGGTTFDWDGSKFVIDLNPTSFTWVQVAGTTQAISKFTGYVCENASLTTLTLPAVASSTFGDSFKVIAFGAGGFKIAQNSNNQILFGDLTTTPGLTGYIQTDVSDTYNSITLVCIFADGVNAIWALDGAPQGNYSVN